MTLTKKMVADEKEGFEVSPPPIPDNEIMETVTADVVVVGAGIAGLTAAVSAAEGGANVVLLEKGPTYNFRGSQNAAINSSIQQKEGYEVDRDRVIATIMEWGDYRADQRVVTRWADNCSQVLDWLIDKAKAANIDVILDPVTKPWYFPNYPTVHMFWTKEPDRPKFQEALANMLQNNAISLGVKIRFNTPAVRLIREGNGRVTGVIAQTKGGEYIRFTAGKAVVLCTGDYGGDSQMVEKYCIRGKEISSLKLEYEGGLNTGDGHKMGMWIGADIDDLPHCLMLWDFAVFMKNGLFNLGRQPWLFVNLNGERFMNEDLPWAYECHQMLRQPGGLAWSVWDAKYNQEWPRMKSQCCKNMGPPLYRFGVEMLPEALKKGKVLTAMTIEELAQKMQVPVAVFKATVDRYSELARSGKDIDYGKHPDRLTTLELPPFYACPMEVRRMVILSGLKINDRLQVLDTKGNPIQGLYAAGNVSGSFFGGSVYPTTIPGLTHSRAWTFGRLAGLAAAKERV